MRGATVLKELSRRAPVIVILTLCTALLGYWTEAPLWLPRGLAITAGGLALILMATRNRRRTLSAETESDNAGWLTHELAGSGSPSGTYLLAFFAVVTIALTGFQGTYALPAWVVLALIAAWAMANAQYPSGDDPEGDQQTRH
jgi:hypothetical protein